MVIDFHTHAFPRKLAEKAMGVLQRNAGNLAPYTDGTAESLEAYLAKHDVDRCVLLNIATNERQQHSVNDFAIAMNRAPIVSFGSVFPGAPDALEELERLRAAGIKGIKLHPDYQKFFVDDPAVFPIYRRAAELGMITVFHSGVDIEYFEPVHCTPERLLRALPEFGGAPVAAAHMGAYLCWYDVERYLVGQNVYLDTAFSYGRMPREHARRIILNHGADKVLLGSDLPWSGTHNEIRFIRSLELSAEQEAAILGGNAARLLGL